MSEFNHNEDGNEIVRNSNRNKGTTRIRCQGKDREEK